MVKTNEKTLILILLIGFAFSISFIKPKAWDLNDQPITELNGLTLNEVFENANIFNEMYFNDWSIVNADLVSNDEKKITIQGQTANLEGSFNYFLDLIVSNNDKIYLRYEWDSEFINDTDLVIFTNTSIIVLDTITTKNYSNIIDIDNSNLITRVRFDINNGNNIYQQMIYKPYFINITSLGIDTLTKEQMDHYYSMYEMRNNANYDLDDTDHTNILNVFKDLQDVLLGTEDSPGFVGYADEFLTTERTIGFKIDFLGIDYQYTFIPIQLLGTSLFIVLMGLVLIKKFIPLA